MRPKSFGFRYWSSNAIEVDTKKLTLRRYTMELLKFFAILRTKDETSKEMQQFKERKKKIEKSNDNIEEQSKE